MKCFTFLADEIESRFDPSFYTFEYVRLNKILKNCKYKLEHLGNLLNEIYRYPTFYNIDFKKEGVPCIKTINITKNGLLKDLESGEYDYIDNKVSKRFPRTILQENDLVLTVRGATIGKIALITKEFVGSNINPNLIRLSLKKEKIISYYFWIYFNSNIGQKLFLKEVANTAKQTITVPQIKNLLIPIPPIVIQEKIVALTKQAYSLKKFRETEAKRLLDSINDYVLDELEIKLPELKNKMVYVVNSDEVQNKRANAYYYQPKYEEVKKAIKKGKYAVKELKEITDKLLSGQRPKGGVRQIREGIPSLGGEHVLIDGSIATTDLKYIPKEFHKKQLKSKVQKKDIIIVKDGATTGKVGIIPEDYPFEEVNINEHVFLIRIKQKINPYFVFSILKSQLGQIQINREITGGTIMGIIRETIEFFKIPLPPITVQNKIAEEVKKRMQKAEQLQKESKKELAKAKKEVEKIILEE